MANPMNRQSLLQEMLGARRELMRSLKFIGEKEATGVEFRPKWCVRDVISHITAVEVTALAATRHLVEEGMPLFYDPVGEREFNIAAIQRRKDFSLVDVVDELDGTRRQLLKLLRRVSDPDLLEEFPVGHTDGMRSLADVLHHIATHDYEHAHDLWQWRADAGLLKRDRFRDLVLIERRTLLDSLSGLFEDDMASVAVCGHWTVQDVMAHVLSWDEEAYRTAEVWTAERPWQEDTLYDDEWNEAEVTRRAGLTVIDLADGLATYHRRWLQMFDRLSDQELVQPGVAPWGESMALVCLFMEMAGHDAVHAPDLRRLQETMQRHW
jgi:hypothetical protein